MVRKKNTGLSVLNKDYTSENPFTYIFDLDDTLRASTELYDEARQYFADRVIQDFNIEATENDIFEIIDEHHSEKLKQKGNHEKEGFPRTLENLYRWFAEETVHSYSGRDIDHGAAKSFRNGWEVVDMDPADYRDQGFIGESYGIDAEDVLAYLSTREDTELHLLTAGPEEVQRPKIEGLELDRYISEENIHLVERDKKAKMGEIAGFNGIENTCMVGNSMTSDMKPAQEIGLGLLVHFNFDDWESDYFDDGVDTDVPEYVRVSEIGELLDVHNEVVSE